MYSVYCVLPGFYLLNVGENYNISYSLSQKYEAKLLSFTWQAPHFTNSPTLVGICALEVFLTTSIHGEEAEEVELVALEMSHTV